MVQYFSSPQSPHPSIRLLGSDRWVGTRYQGLRGLKLGTASTGSPRWNRAFGRQGSESSGRLTASCKDATSLISTPAWTSESASDNATTAIWSRLTEVDWSGP